MIELRDDRYCFVCGDKNPIGLRLEFSPCTKGICARYTPIKEHQGWQDLVHGGIISTLLDEAMVKASIEAGFASVTAEITIRFKEPLSIGEETLIEAGIKEPSGRLIEAEAVMKRLRDGRTIATARGKLIRIK